MEPEGSIPNSRELSLPWVRPIQPISPHPTSTRSILILFNHLGLGLPRGLFPSGFPIILWNPKVQYRIRKSSPPVSILSQTSPVHITPSDLYKIRPNIIQPPTSWSSWWPPSLWFFHQQPKGSIPNSQELSTCPYPEPDQ
jgi:hypothetical protein